jgi:hypothetical protein
VLHVVVINSLSLRLGERDLVKIGKLKREID